MNYKVLEQEIEGVYNMHGSDHIVRYKFKLMDEKENIIKKLISRSEYKGGTIEDCVGKIIQIDEYGFEVIGKSFKLKTKNLYKESGNSYIYTSGLEI